MGAISVDVIKGWGTSLVGLERELLDREMNPMITAKALGGVSSSIRHAADELDPFVNGDERQALEGIAALLDGASTSARGFDVDPAIWDMRDASSRLLNMQGALDQSAQGVYMLG